MLSRLLAALAVALTVSACSLRTGEEIAPTRIVVNPAKEGCLAQVDKVLDRYFSGKIAEPELDGFWNCLEKALATFAQNTQGKNHAQDGNGGHDGYYTPQELGAFLTRYFLKGKVVDDALLREVMHLKQGLFGGASDRLTGSEIVRIQELLRVIHRETLALRPYMPITAKNFKDRGYSSELFEKALATFEQSMKRIGHAVADAPGSYSFDRMAGLLDALKVFLYGTKSSEENTWIETARIWTDALRPAKAIFVAPPRDEIRPADWQRIYELAPRYYGLFMRTSFYLQVKKSDYYTWGPGLDRVDYLIQDAHSLFSLVLEHREPSYITSEEISELLKSLANNNVWPVGLQLETANAFAGVLFNRILSVPLATEGYQVSIKKFDRVRDAFLFGTEGLRALEAFYRSKFGERFREGLIPREEFRALPTEELFRHTRHQRDVSRNAIESLRASALEVKTTFAPNGSMVEIPRDGAPSMLSYQHLAIVHLFRTINRVIFAGYTGSDRNRLDEAQLKTLANDFFPFLQDIGVGTPAPEFLPDRLLEASLFLYSSDGDKSLSMTSAIELETLMTSTVSRADELHAEISQRCRPQQSGDLRPEEQALYYDGRNPLVEPNCYRRDFVAHQVETWRYLPGLADAVRALSEEQQAELFNTMESFLRRKKNRDDFFSISDTQAFVLLPYYVEMLFSRYDQDHDGFLDNEEAKAAYTTIKPFLKKMLEDKSPEMREAVFYYLLAYGEVPDTTWGQMLVLWHRYLGNRQFRNDRLKVVGIFSSIFSYIEAHKAAPAKR